VTSVILGVIWGGLSHFRSVKMTFRCIILHNRPSIIGTREWGAALAKCLALLLLLGEINQYKGGNTFVGGGGGGVN
jgi:hypothetical protein